MASLEKCADALLQHKALQSTTHEHLVRRVQELERGRRSICVSLRALMSAAQRRARDVADMVEASRACEVQLAQDRLKLGALTMAAASDRASRERIAGGLCAIADTWAGQPTRIVQLVRALQERSALRRAAATAAGTLRAATGLVQCLCDVRALRTWVATRLARQQHHLGLFQASVERRTREAQAHTAEQHAAAAALVAQATAVQAENAAGAAALVLAAATVSMQSVYVEAMAQQCVHGRAVVATACEQVELQAQQLAHRQERQRCAQERVRLAVEHRTRAAERRELRRAEHTAALQAQSALVERWSAATAEHHEAAAVAAERTSAATAEAAHLLRSVRAAAALVLDRARRHRTLLSEVARRVAEAGGAAAALEQLRERHEAHVAALHATRQAQRLHDAMTALTTEEGLTRRREVLGREADAFQLLTERERLAASAAAATAAARQSAAVTRPTGRRPRRRTGSSGSTLAEALGLGRGASPRASGRRTHPGTAPRTAALFTSPQKERVGGRAMGKRPRSEWPGRAMGSTSAASVVSALPSPPPRLPAAGVTRTYARPLPRTLAPQMHASGLSGGGALAGSGAAVSTQAPRLTALSTGDRRPLDRHTRAAPVAAAALRPTFIRAKPRTELFIDTGEDLFADIFS